MQDNIRSIVPVGLSGLAPEPPAMGMPICEMVDPAALYVDPSY